MSHPVTVRRAAEILGCHRQYIHALIRQGKLKVVARVPGRGPTGLNTIVDGNAVHRLVRYGYCLDVPSNRGPKRKFRRPEGPPAQETPMDLPDDVTMTLLGLFDSGHRLAVVDGELAVDDPDHDSEYGPTHLPGLAEALDALEARGWVEIDGEDVRVTQQGRYAVRRYKRSLLGPRADIDRKRFVLPGRHSHAKTVGDLRAARATA